MILVKYDGNNFIMSLIIIILLRASGRCLCMSMQVSNDGIKVVKRSEEGVRSLENVGSC